MPPRPMSESTSKPPKRVPGAISPGEGCSSSMGTWAGSASAAHSTAPRAPRSSALRGPQQTQQGAEQDVADDHAGLASRAITTRPGHDGEPRDPAGVAGRPDAQPEQRAGAGGGAAAAQVPAGHEAEDAAEADAVGEVREAR